MFKDFFIIISIVYSFYNILIQNINFYLIVGNRNCKKKRKTLKKYKAQKPLKGKNVLRVKENMLLAFHKISWYKNVAVACGSVRKTSKIQMILFLLQIIKKNVVDTRFLFFYYSFINVFHGWLNQLIDFSGVLSQTKFVSLNFFVLFFQFFSSFFWNQQLNE